MPSITVRNHPALPFRADQYVLDEGLRNAVEVALALHQPLLLTGEPGTGKTRLAYKVAAELSADRGEHEFPAQPLVFHTKTTSTARDLFYTYDALSHFQAANIRRDLGAAVPGTADFIELQALGLAIARTAPAVVDGSKFRTVLGERALSTVVLVDEVDKAPRDFANDLLNELDNYEFFIREQDNYAVRRDPAQRIFVVLTSNSEKNLPDAFLRRCVFYHIPFPDKAQLMHIAQVQLGAESGYTEELLAQLLDTFGEVRRRSVRKPPATAELLAWLRLLGLSERFFEKTEAEQRRQMLQNLSVLVKTKEDLDAVRGMF